MTEPEDELALQAALSPERLGLPGFQRRWLLPTGATVETSVLEGGTGEPLLLLPGGVASGAASYLSVLPELAKGWHVVAADLPGCGFTPRLPSPIDTQALIRWLESLIDEIKPVALVASSISGALALHAWSSLHRRQIPVVLVGAPSIVPFRPPMLSGLLFGAFVTMPCNLTLYLLAKGTKSVIHDTPAIRSFAEGTLLAMKRAGGRKFLADLQPLSALVPTQTLAHALDSGMASGIWGRNDPFVPLSELPRQLPLLAVEGAGHYPFMDCPEEFTATLTRTFRVMAERIPHTRLAQTVFAI